MAERLVLRYKNFAAPGNVEETYATKVGGVTATLTHYLEKAKTTVHEESGFLEFEIAVGAEDSHGNVIPNTAAHKYLANVSDISTVYEY